MALYDRVWFTTATTGTGTVTVGSALSSYQTPAGASVPNAGPITYTILDGTAWETGTGVYTTSGTTVSRVLVASSTGSLLNLSGTATMFFTALASKTPQLDLAQTWSAAQTFSALPVLSGGGISFPATQVPSADANTLDDYEEGTFTPALKFGGNSVGMTYTNQAGRYTKIGNRVDVCIIANLLTKGSSTTAATITGLPFTANGSVPQAVGCMFASAMTTVAMPMCRIVQGTSSITLHDFTGSTVADLTHADFTDSTGLGISITYHV